MCLMGHAQDIYARLVQACQAHTQRIVATIADLPVDLDATALLEHVERVWLMHCSQMKTVGAIYLYLDRTFVMANASSPGSNAVRSIRDLGLSLFRREIAQGDTFDRVVAAILDLVRDERNGAAIGTTLVANVVTMTRECSLYADLESKFLDATNAYYMGEGARLCDSDDRVDVPEYLQHVMERLSQESTRISTYMHEESRLPCVQALERALVAAHLKRITDDGFSPLMSANRIEDLARMYHLVGRVKSVDALRRALSRYIVDRGMTIIAETDGCKPAHDDVIHRIADLKDQVDRTIEKAFDGNVDCVQTGKDAFETFMKSRGNYLAEALARTIDWLLRGAGELGSDDELDRRLQRCMVIFRFIHGKDIFEAFYKKYLAQRLLLSQSCSDAAETSMVAKLRTECGALFTTKLESMFKDMDLSAEYRTLFKQFQGDADQDAIEFQAHVLTTSSWPITPPAVTKIVLPAAVAHQQEVFTNFYKGRHTGRKLTWVYDDSHAVLRANFPQGRKDLAVTGYQALVLLAFNVPDPVLSYAGIRDKTGIEDPQLKHALGSLCRQKARILKKRKKGPICETDEFMVNKEFTHVLYRLTLVSRMPETSAETAQTTDRVIADRQYQIDAILVRHMKSVRECTQAALVAYALEHCDFPAPIEQIHNRITSLIDREYIERDAASSNTLRYVA
ncbi:hypothetical protein PBRA_008624 [Plasmodiophora brassicae]|nr:hypothetical protein PBRA_008624 [Plasmodiophora brassicae]